MTTSVEKTSLWSHLLKGQTIVYIGIIWSFIALLFFLLFSVKPPEEDYPLWYSIGTYILELIPFLAAALLCYRNWQSPQIASGRNVWLGIGLGMLCYFLGDLVYGWWELYWGMDPYVSPADLFYIAFYILVGWGMLLAVLPRRLNLELKQWIIVGVIGILGIIISVWLTVIIPAGAQKTPETSQLPFNDQRQTLIASADLSSFNTKPFLAQTKKPAPPTATQQPTPTEKPAQIEKTELSNAELRRPKWVDSLDQFLTKFKTPVNFFYIIADLILLIIATTLLLAFWGGRFSQSWRMIALATFSLYLVDTWNKYNYAIIEAQKLDYESGSLFEVLFIISAVLFGIGAAFEYDISSATRTRGRRRRGAN